MFGAKSTCGRPPARPIDVLRELLDRDPASVTHRKATASGASFCRNSDIAEILNRPRRHLEQRDVDQ